MSLHWRGYKRTSCCGTWTQSTCCSPGLTGLLHTTRVLLNFTQQKMARFLCKTLALLIIIIVALDEGEKYWFNVVFRLQICYSAARFFLNIAFLTHWFKSCNFIFNYSNIFCIINVLWSDFVSSTRYEISQVNLTTHVRLWKNL